MVGATSLSVTSLWLMTGRDGMTDFARESRVKKLRSICSHSARV
jgi:hypothetical protein